MKRRLDKEGSWHDEEFRHSTGLVYAGILVRLIARRINFIRICSDMLQRTVLTGC
jgi:hypothetical protein